MEEIKRIKELTTLLNHHRDSYYNGSKPKISDYEYDNLYDELKSLEDKTGILFNNSPTQSVGYEVKSKLEKVIHNHPMLSLDKTKSVSDLIQFSGDKDYLLSLKMDGLTVLLTYEDGKLIQAETRGNGEVGELITHNAKVFENIPTTINYAGHLEIEGEAIITYGDFEKINSILADDDKYKNPRNLVSGSVRQLNNEVAAKRHIKFVCWKVPTDKTGVTIAQRLSFAKSLGFDVVPYVCTNDLEHMDSLINNLKNIANEKGYPIDGLVMTYDDISYGNSLGMTGHHPKHSIAFKFYDEEVSSILKGIDWTMGKSGCLTPTAMFKAVEIEGTTVERASLHNVSILKGLKLGVGDEITVYKANAIIPQIRENLTQSDTITIPNTCPICSGKTEIIKDNNTEVLICTNPDCKGKLLGKLTHAASKNALNIDGLSEETINTLIKNELVEDIYSIYELRQSKEKLLNIERFGKKKVENLLTEIENSKDIKLENFIIAWSIPLVGRTVSKDISKFVGGDLYEFVRIMVHESGIPFTKIDGFGKTMYEALVKWWNEYCSDFLELAEIMRFEEKIEKIISGGTLEGKNFCVTGKLNLFENRDALVADIESKGGHFVSSVSKTTNYLINNDNLSQSSKNAKAASLKISIITEKEYVEMSK